MGASEAISILTCYLFFEPYEEVSEVRDFSSYSEYSTLLRSLAMSREKVFSLSSMGCEQKVKELTLWRLNEGKPRGNDVGLERRNGSVLGMRMQAAFLKLFRIINIISLVIAHHNHNSLIFSSKNTAKPFTFTLLHHFPTFFAPFLIIILLAKRDELLQPAISGRTNQPLSQRPKCPQKQIPLKHWLLQQPQHQITATQSIIFLLKIHQTQTDHHRGHLKHPLTGIAASQTRD